MIYSHHLTVRHPHSLLCIQLTTVAVKSNEHPYPTCSLPTDLFHLPTINEILPLSFAYCRPPKFSKNTLGPSGSTFGLAPSEHLSQTGSKSILQQLVDKEAIKRPVFSLFLLNTHEGVLSVGGTAARAVDHVISETRKNLDRAGAATGGDEQADLDNETKMKKRAPVPKSAKDLGSRDSEWEKECAWSHCEGAEGYWQILMQAVWMNGMRVLRNQAVIIDVPSPFLFPYLPPSLSIPSISD